MVKADSRARWCQAMAPQCTVSEVDMKQVEEHAKLIGRKRRRSPRMASPAPKPTVNAPSPRSAAVSRISPPAESKREASRRLAVAARRSLAFGLTMSSIDDEEVSIAARRACLESVGIADDEDTEFVGRESEMAELVEHFSHASASAKKMLVLVGTPGVGKSSCVDRAFAKFQSERKPDSVLVSVNCNVHDSAEEVYYDVKEQVRQQTGLCLPQFRSSPMHAFLKADRICKLKMNVVLILDELDDLISRDSKARLCSRRLIGFFAQLSQSPLFKCVAIMNDTLVQTSMATQLLEQHAIQTRALVFKPYDYDTLKRVLEAHIESALRSHKLALEVNDLCPGRALELLARKIHSHAHGDVRCVRNVLAACVDLSLARLDAATEARQTPDQCALTMADAVKYVRENFMAPAVRCVRSYLPENLRVALLAVIISTRVSWCSFVGVLEAYKDLRTSNPWLQRLTARPMQEQLELLRKNGLIEIKTKRRQVTAPWKHAMIKARMSIDEFVQSTRDDAAIANVLATLDDNQRVSNRRRSARLEAVGSA